jgi:hypothetical protein
MHESDLPFMKAKKFGVTGFIFPKYLVHIFNVAEMYECTMKCQLREKEDIARCVAKHQHFSITATRQGSIMTQ